MKPLDRLLTVALERDDPPDKGFDPVHHLSRVGNLRGIAPTARGDRFHGSAPPLPPQALKNIRLPFLVHGQNHGKPLPPAAARNGRSPGSGEERLGQRFAGRVPFLSRQRRRFLDVIQPKRRETARVQPPRR